MAFGPLVLRPGRWAARGRSGRRLASRGHQRARSSVLRKHRAPAPRCPGPARERAEPRDRRSFCGPPPRLVPPPAGPSLVPCLSRVQTEVLTGMSAEQKRWSGRAGGKARTRGARARAGGRGAQAGRGSTEGVRAALPAASGTAAWTRRAHRRGPCAGRPHGAEGLPCVSGASRERRRPAHSQPRGSHGHDLLRPAGPNSLAERRTSGCVQPSPPPHASVSSWPPRLRVAAKATILCRGPEHTPRPATRRPRRKARGGPGAWRSPGTRRMHGTRSRCLRTSGHFTVAGAQGPCVLAEASPAPRPALLTVEAGMLCPFHPRAEETPPPTAQTEASGRCRPLDPRPGTRAASCWAAPGGNESCGHRL